MCQGAIYFQGTSFWCLLHLIDCCLLGTWCKLQRVWHYFVLGAVTQGLSIFQDWRGSLASSTRDLVVAYDEVKLSMWSRQRAGMGFIIIECNKMHQAVRLLTTEAFSGHPCRGVTKWVYAVCDFCITHLSGCWGGKKACLNTLHCNARGLYSV